MNRLRIWYRDLVIRKLCRQNRMRSAFVGVFPPEGARFLHDGNRQVCLEIFDKKTSIPYARLYLHPDKMREFLKWGLKAVDRYEEELNNE